jgi:uncharacterized membrane protein YfcA
VTLLEGILLTLGSFLAGVINSFAGGGAFITLPLLILLGLTPTSANMTSTVATLPGLLTAAWAYRRPFERNRAHLKLLTALGITGGTLGAWILLASPAAWFSRAVPYLMLFATICFIYGSWFLKRPAPHGGAKDPIGAALGLALFLVALYGGYWGGGMGIITLAALTLGGWNKINEMNAVKTVYMALINITGAILFTLSGQVAWAHALLVFLGSAIGGYVGAHTIQKVDQRLVRAVIALYASGMTLYFFLRFS